jgi:hypothetical protein
MQFDQDDSAASRLSSLGAALAHKGLFSVVCDDLAAALERWPLHIGDQTFVIRTGETLFACADLVPDEWAGEIDRREPDHE